MNLTRFFCLATFILAACGGTTDSASDTSNQSTESSTAADVISSDSGMDEDVQEADLCEHPCKSEFDKNDKKLCPTPQSDWNCVDGCCVPVFKCQTDEDCTEVGFTEGQCLDTSLSCLCEASTGACYSAYCGVDADCGEGSLCAAGSCVALPSQEALELRILNTPSILSPGQQVSLKVEAFHPTDVDLVTSVSVTWSSSDAEVLIVDEQGVLTGGEKAGDATITAASGEMSTSITMRTVVAADGDTHTILAHLQGSLDAVVGRYALVDSSTGETLAHGNIPDDGTIRYASDSDDTIDVHIFGENTDWVSWLGMAPGIIDLPITPVFWTAIQLNPEGELVAEESVLKGADVLKGAVSLGNYDKLGEIELSISALPLSSTLFDFTLETIIGNSVKRYFHPEHQIPGVGKRDVAEIPGGLTFSLAGPAIPDFALATPKGRHLVWTLGGRIGLEELAEFTDDIFDAFGGGGIDFSMLLSFLVPLFRDFWTTVDLSPDSTGEGDATILEMSPELRVPLLLTGQVMVPELPAMAELGYADSVFVIPGALTHDALFLPLGLSAGSDSSDASKFPVDGVADGDEHTPEHDPFEIHFAPLHSSLPGPHTSYAVAVVAACIRANDDDPRPEGGSAIFHREAPGKSLSTDVNPEDFLPFPMESQWLLASRELTIQAMAGADTQRVSFKGKEGEHWTVWMNGNTSYSLPVPSDLVGEEIGDRSTEPLIVVLTSFDFDDEFSLEELVAPGSRNIQDLLQVVDRSSFVDLLHLSQEANSE